MRDLLFAIRREGIYQALRNLLSPEARKAISGRLQLDTETFLSCFDGLVDGMQTELDDEATDAEYRALLNSAIAMLLDLRKQFASEQAFLQ